MNEYEYWNRYHRELAQRQRAEMLRQIEIAAHSYIESIIDAAFIKSLEVGVYQELPKYVEFCGRQYRVADYLGIR